MAKELKLVRNAKPILSKFGTLIGGALGMFAGGFIAAGSARSDRVVAQAMAAGSVLDTHASAPHARAKASLPLPREMAVTTQPMALAMRMPIWPSPPTPTMPTRVPRVAL